MFGTLPGKGPLEEVTDIYLKALGGKRETFAPVDFPKILNRDNQFPPEVRIQQGKPFVKTNHTAIDSALS